ncbi:MAG: amidohydrolase family protein [Clostridiales bacterium]|nr:amidohydrolase family protein [Clostridiales bacterium]
MGLARGIFMMDTHTYAQLGQNRFADNSAMLLWHMEKYGVDKCIIKNTVGRSNQINADIVQRYPDKFIAICNDSETQNKSQTGEIKWTIEAAIKEIDGYLATGLYKGIGDGLARDRTKGKKLIPWDERLDQICQIMELARKYKVPVIYHVGIPVGSSSSIDMARSRAHAETCDNGNPLLCHEVASLYPDVPILMAHGGIEASAYYMDDYEKCLNVAGSHKNVFLETGQWWAELYDKPLKDANIGAKKLVWGCGWGQRNVLQHWMPGQIPTTYTGEYLDHPGDNHQADIWGWSLRELGRLNIPQDDLNLILGGNAAYLYDVETPLPHKRLFKHVNRGFEKFVRD